MTKPELFMLLCVGGIFAVAGLLNWRDRTGRTCKKKGHETDWPEMEICHRCGVHVPLSDPQNRWGRR